MSFVWDNFWKLHFWTTHTDHCTHWSFCHFTFCNWKSRDDFSPIITTLIMTVDRITWCYFQPLQSHKIEVTFWKELSTAVGKNLKDVTSLGTAPYLRLIVDFEQPSPNKDDPWHQWIHVQLLQNLFSGFAWNYNTYFLRANTTFRKGKI